MRPFPDRQGAGMPAVYRITAGVVTAVLVGVAGAVVLYQTSVQPGAAIVAAVFERGRLVTPPAGFARIARTVTGQRVPVPTPSSAATVADYAILLAHAGYTVASLDYSLAPGPRYPVPVRQGNAALRFLRANAGRSGGDPARIVLGGDPAGAQIASELAAAQTDPGLARSAGLTAAVPPGALRGVVLFCGLYDLRTVGSTGFPALRTYLRACTGVRDWTSYPAIDQLSTVPHVTSGYRRRSCRQATPIRSRPRPRSSPPP
jgi:alpha/beta hydrolase fold